MSWLAQIRQWLTGKRDRRKVPRSPGGSIVAHYWSGGAPAPRKVANVSADGVYIETPDTWSPGTVIALTFQVVPETGEGTDRALAEPAACVVVAAMVVRTGADGFGLRFLFADNRQKARFQQFLSEAAPKQNAGPQLTVG